MTMSVEVQRRDRPTFKVIRDAILLLTRRERLYSLGLLALMTLTGVLEATVVAAVLPLVYSMVDPASVAKLPILPKLFDLSGEGFRDILPYLAAGLIVLLIVSAALSLLTTCLTEFHSESCRNRLAREVLNRVVRSPYAWFVRQQTPVLAKVVYDDVRIWQRDCIQSVLAILQAMALILFPAAAGVALAPAGGLLGLGGVAVAVIVLMMAVRRPIYTVSSRARSAHNHMMTALMQILTGMREVKTCNQSNFFLDAFDHAHEATNRLSVVARLLGTGPTIIVNLLAQVAFIGTTLYLWLYGHSGAEIMAQMALLGVLVSRVVPAANRLNAAMATLVRSVPYVNGLLRMIEEAEVDRGWLGAPASATRSLPDDWHSIRFEGVEYRFPGSDAGVAGLDLLFERGKAYGVVGPSGAGKSTFMSLFLGLLAPTSGRILVDGVDRETFSPHDWLDHIAYVPQDVFIADATLAENVLFGLGEIDVVRLDQAMRVASLEDVVAGLPDGYNTHMGERGRRFSGGQAQRLAVARACYREPKVLLLDEATSALDAFTEAKVQENVIAMGSDVLTIAIAHRVRSLRNCDTIFVMAEGKLVDSGSYNELLERSDLFRRLSQEAEMVGDTP